MAHNKQLRRSTVTPLIHLYRFFARYKFVTYLLTYLRRSSTDEIQRSGIRKANIFGSVVGLQNLFVINSIAFLSYHFIVVL